MKEENNIIDEDGCTSFSDILKAMDLDEPEYDVVLSTGDDLRYSDENEPGDEPVVNIEYKSALYFNY